MYVMEVRLLRRTGREKGPGEPLWDFGMAGNMQAGQGPGTELCKYCCCSGVQVQVALQYSRHGGEGEASPGVWVCVWVWVWARGRSRDHDQGLGTGDWDWDTGTGTGTGHGTGAWEAGKGGLEVGGRGVRGVWLLVEVLGG